MGDKCNCYRFSPRDSLSGAVAQIADYLSKHPGWNETELRAFVDGLISSAGVETFNGRSGNVTLNKDDVNNLLIANCYFAEADETIESIDVLTLYKLGIRIVFTQYSSEVGGYTLAYGIEYYPATDTAKPYLFSSGSGGVGAVVSVNGKTGTVVLKASDILMNNGDSVENAVSNAEAIANAAYSPDNSPPYPVNSVNSKTGSVMLKVVDVSNGDSVDDNAYIFIDETENYPDIIAPDSNKLGGQIPSYYATAESVNSLKDDKLDKTGTAADASKLGGVAASNYALKTDTAPDSSKLGGKAPEYYTENKSYVCKGMIFNALNSTIEGIGTCTIISRPNGLAELHFVVTISNGPAPSEVNVFGYGLNRDILRKKGAPNITPLSGGIAEYIKNGQLDTDIFGYGGTFEAESQFWKPSRVYNDAGSVGGWPTSKFAVGMVITGMCFGTYER